MDLSKMSDKDLEAMAAGNYAAMSDSGLEMLAQSGPATSPEMQAPKEPGFLDQYPNLGKALHYGLMPLGYLGGLSRTAAAGLANIPYYATTGESLTKPEDVTAALKGEAPPTSTYLERAGVGPGPSLSQAIPGAYSDTGEGLVTFKKGGPLDITARGAAGFAGDVALDPLSYTGLGFLAKYPRLQKILGRPLSAPAEKTGIAMYKGGLKRIDRRLQELGKEGGVSDVLMEHGVWGSAPAVEKKMYQLGDELLAKRDALLQAAGEAGQNPSMRNAVDKVMTRVQEMRATRDPQLQSVADQLEKTVKEYLALDPHLVEEQVGKKFVGYAGGPEQQIPTGRLTGGYEQIPETAAMTPITPKYEPVIERYMTPPVTPLEASGFKTTITKGLPKNAWEITQSGRKPAEVAGMQDLATGLQKEVERVTPGVGEINQKLGKILSGREKMAMEARKEIGKDLFSSVDAIGAGFALGNSLAKKPSVIPLAVAATKKFGDISKGMAFRTGIGLGLRNAGIGNYAAGKFITPAADAAVRQWLGGPQSPWFNMGEE